jgi:hypothetical protein
MLSILFFFLCVTAITRQVPFYQLANIISPSLILIFVFSIPFLLKNFWDSDKLVKYILILNVIVLTILLAYSILIQQNSVPLGIRFYSIFVLLYAAFFLPPKRIYVSIFIALAVFHSILLIGFETYIVLYGDPEFAGYIRSKVMEYGLGDVYTFNQYFYRIQIKGNPVLPIAFLVSLFAIQSKRLKISAASLLFVGTIIAGNFAFILAIVFFFVMYGVILFFSNPLVARFLKQLVSNRKRILVLTASVVLVCILAGLIIFPYLKELFLLKMQVSIPTRFDQAFHLIESLIESPQTILFGQGLGNVINVISDYRDYRTYYYYELQTIYILNQVGILYFLLFVFTKITLAIKFWNNKYIYLIYLSYLVYALTNPYLFDTTNIVVLIVLSSLAKLYLKEGINSESKI